MNKKIIIDVVGSARYRNINAKAHLILADDRVIYEAIGVCDFYKDPEVDSIERPYYVRQVYKKENCSGIELYNNYFSEIQKEVYDVTILIIGSKDDIVIRYEDRKEAYKLYTDILNWIFPNKPSGPEV